MKSCKVCSKTDKNMEVCSACKSARYCSINCQRSDWKSHKKECFKLNQVFFSDLAIETVFNNTTFNKISQYAHHVNISDDNIKNKLMLCLISPNFDESNKINSYSCIINIAPVSEFSEDISLKFEKDKRCIFMIYHDKINNDMNSSKGSVINFNFDYEKRETLCYESIRMLKLPSLFTIYLDGRCE